MKEGGFWLCLLDGFERSGHFLSIKKGGTYLGAKKEWEGREMKSGHLSKATKWGSHTNTESCVGRAWLCKDAAVSQAEKVSWGLEGHRRGHFHMQRRKAEAFWQRSYTAGFTS